METETFGELLVGDGTVEVAVGGEGAGGGQSEGQGDDFDCSWCSFVRAFCVIRGVIRWMRLACRVIAGYCWRTTGSSCFRPEMISVRVPFERPATTEILRRPDF